MGAIGVLFALIISVGLAYYITMSLVKRSNDVGDSTGTLRDFGKLNIIMTMDDLRSTDFYSGEGKKTLKEHANKMK
ncbi:MAG: hypothetical protein K6E95_04140 [Lachnospiraceae bacterium]|nr:hypothetical protein [Lachnospiraceae bacterium]